MTAPAHKRSIPTVYGETKFRSKLEADWARAFDALGVTWEYEKEGRYFGDVFYLADFWLPASRQLVEVKGVFEPNDVRKIRAVVEHAKPRRFTSDDQPDVPIVAALVSGTFYGWVRRDQPTEDWYEFLTRDSRAVDLLCCTECHEWWFAYGGLGQDCQCCGYNGRWVVANELQSPLIDFPDVAELRRYCSKPCEPRP